MFKGLFHIPDPVFNYFLQLHALISLHLSVVDFNLHEEKTLSVCREVIFTDLKLNLPSKIYFPWTTQLTK